MKSASTLFLFACLFRGRTNYISIFFNLCYLICRYYFLHGLLSFPEWACFIH